MAGRRLLDAAAIFKASRSIVSKYITFRGHQLDTFSKTSSVAKAIKKQTERVTLTLRAASALNERLNSPSPQHSAQAHNSGSPSFETPSAGKDSAGEENFRSGPRDGLEQDHFHTRSEGNTIAQPLPHENLGVKQEAAKRNPFPDGSVPPEDSVINKLEQDRVAFPETQHAVPAKESGVISKSEAELIPKSSGSSAIPKSTTATKSLTPEKARRLQRLAESQIPSRSAVPPASGDLGPKHETAALAVDQGKDVYYTAPLNSGPVLSSLPRVKVPKAAEDAQETDENVADTAINPDVYYTSGQNVPDHIHPQAQAIFVQDSPLEDTFSEIFQSPKVARLLNGEQRHGGIPEGLKMQAPQQITTNQSKSPKNGDQNSYSTRQAPTLGTDTTQKTLATEDTTADHGKGKVDVLAADMAEDKKLDTPQESNVCYN